MLWVLKEPSHWDDFDHPKQKFKLLDMKILTILRWKLFAYMDQCLFIYFMYYTPP